MSIGVNTRGDLLLSCKSNHGCSPAGILAALGMKPGEMFADYKPSGNGARRKGGRGRIVAEYDYRDESGALLYQVVRFDPKDFRQRRPDGAGGWSWKLDGVRRVPCKLPELIGKPGALAFVAEGEKDVGSLEALGLLATCNPGGAGKWRKLDPAAVRLAFSGRPVVVLPDADEPGVAHGRDVARSLAGLASSVKLVEIHDLPDHGAPCKDVTDWLAAGGTRAELEAAAERAPEFREAPGKARASDPEVSDPAERPSTWVDRPIVLPSNAGLSILDSASAMFRRIAPSHRLFTRARTIVRLIDDEGALRLEPLRPAAFCSFVEAYGPVYTTIAVDEETALKRAVMPKDSAEKILAAEGAMDRLPSIRGIVSRPIIANVAGEPRILGRGYHSDLGGILVASGEEPPDLSLGAAADILLPLVEEFDFASPGDRSRAIAAFLTPALRLGGWIRGPVPIDVAEADQSQAGKGYRQKLIFAVYGEQPAMIGKKDGGVGGLDESICQALIDGRPLIVLDNLRARVDSQYLEMLVTADGIVGARVPHRGEVPVNARHFLFYLTSNGVEATVDLANRASIVRIRKRVDYRFRSFPEGDLLAHVQENQTLYLGAVFACVREWARAGRPSTGTTAHDFREWAGAAEWIVRDLLREAPLFEGHRATQTRIANPALTFLRTVALTVQRIGLLGVSLNASKVGDLCEDHGIEIPGLQAADEDSRRKRVGVLLGRCFATEGAVRVDEILVTRSEETAYDPTYQGSRTHRSYRFALAPEGAPAAQDPVTAQAAQDPEL